MELSVPHYIPPPTNYRRAVGGILVIILHVVVIYAFATGLATTMIEKVRGPIETKIIQEVKQEKEEPPPPPPKFQAPPPVFVPTPDINITEAVTDTNAITNTTNVKAPPAPPPAPKKDVVILPRQDPRHPITSAEEMYPAMSKRLGEEGSVVLLLTVADNGRVTDAKIQTSSGFERLDEAAQKEAVRSWRFLPGTLNGAASAMQMSFRVRFQLSK